MITTHEKKYPYSSFVKTKIGFLSTLFLLFCVLGYAQYQPLLGLDYGRRAEQIWDVYELALRGSVAVESEQKVDLFERFTKKSGDKELILDADLLRTMYLMKFEPKKEELILHRLDSLFDEASKIGFKQLLPRITRSKAEYYWNVLGNYELGFENYDRLASMLPNLSAATYPDQAFDFFAIANAYYTFKDYHKASVYFKQILPLPNKSRIGYFKNQAYNTLGLIYQSLGKLDLSDQYFLKLRKIKENKRDTFWMAIVDGNLGQNHYLRSQFDQAIPLFKNDIAQAVKHTDWGLASGSSMMLANVYLKQQRYADAETQIMQSKAYVEKSQQYQRKAHLFPLLNKLYTLKGNMKLASMYLDSALMVRDSLDRKFNAMKLLRAQQKLSNEQRQQAISELENKQKIREIQRNVIIGLLVIAILFFVYYYRVQRNKHLLQQKIKSIKISHQQTLLSEAETKLQEFTKQILGNQKQITTLSEQLRAEGNDSTIAQLRQSVILTDDDWDQYRQLFDKAHKGYIYRLKQQYPQLTPAEIRYITLVKLQFNNKEMAAALGISVNTVRSTWHRLRKKMEMDSEEDLTKLLNL